MLRAFVAAGGLQQLLVDLAQCGSSIPRPGRRKRKRPSSRGTSGGRAKVPNLRSTQTASALSLKSATASPLSKAGTEDKGKDAISSSSSESETDAEVMRALKTFVCIAHSLAAFTIRMSRPFCSAPVS